MGVYIKGMTIEQLRRMGVAGIMLSEERLIEVKEPHGRLVDLDKMIEELWDGNSMEVGKFELRFISTIIEAEGK